MGRQGLASQQRILTVRCKTKSATVYHFDSNVFTHLIRHHCEEVIKQKQNKLLRYLPMGEQYRTIEPANKSRKGSVSMNSSYYPPFPTANSFHTVTDSNPPHPSSTGNSFFSTLKPSQQLE
jgi:hypothetical protein